MNSESSLREAYQTVVSENSFSSVDIYIEERISEFESEISEEKRKRVKSMQKDDEFKWPSGDEKMYSILLGTAKETQEKLETDTLSFSDFVYYLVVCTDVDIPDRLAKEFI